MQGYVPSGSLKVSEDLYRFVETEALPASGVSSEQFWHGLEMAVSKFSERQQELLDRRDRLQAAIDEFHRTKPAATKTEYVQFLTDLGYVEPSPSQVTVNTSGIDPEVGSIAGPQLVVPMTNARYALNAANARWGSLYDALYGTDAISRDGDLRPVGAYNPRRGEAVIAFARDFLDRAVPLNGASHAEVEQYAIESDGLVAVTAAGRVTLKSPDSYLGFQGSKEQPTAILLVNHGLHVEIQIDREGSIGKNDPAGVNDILLESAVTAIMDLEDSVAAVDAQDKLLGYRNWLGLMQGTLTEQVTKDGSTFQRELMADRQYSTAKGERFSKPGRALMFVRHVGHHMQTDAVLDSAGQPIFEGILDAFVTGLGACHDLRRTDRTFVNSRAGSIYAVKPKMHGSDEVSLTVDTFKLVEETLGLEPSTIKIGIMDEERRTSLNLAACIAAATDRVAFINTGFLDRTGDEIHTSMHAGALARKNEMRLTEWIAAYEEANVDVGLACGLAGKAQIGKGMWAAPDDMARMLKEKIAHPQSGASCAWVPSPTAATLHAMHYHQVDVASRQAELLASGARDTRDRLLTIPLGDPASWSASDRREELDNNVQSLLGYVVRWIDAGVGCSKVLDLYGTPLMEDRATCRISAQLVANWMLHGVVSAEQVDDSLRRMAAVVDGQNAADPDYLPMAPAFDGHAFMAARELIFEGTELPTGCTEPILHRRRGLQKLAEASA